MVADFGIFWKVFTHKIPYPVPPSISSSADPIKVFLKNFVEALEAYFIGTTR